MRILDAQIHLWTNDNAPGHHIRSPYRFERAMVEMDEAGIDGAINCPPMWDRAAMEYAAAAVAAQPRRFATLGWFPVDKPADEEMVEDLLSDAGVLGLRLLFASAAAAEALLSDQLNWLWRFANARDVPVAFGVPPTLLRRVGVIAGANPRMRVMIDHLAVSPFEKLPAAASHFDVLIELARHANVALKATGVPSMAATAYPFLDTHAHLRRLFDAYGAERMFWGTDITRMQISWQQCVLLFTEELRWLKGRDLELVMGRAVAQWINWKEHA